MVKFSCSASAAWGLLAGNHRRGPSTAHQAMLWWRLTSNRGRLAQMLAQGQSSSKKRKEKNIYSLLFSCKEQELLERKERERK